MDRRHALGATSGQLRHPVLPACRGVSALPERIAFALRGPRNTAGTARKPHRRGARRREPSGTVAQVAQALGLNREKVLAAEPLPAAKALVSTFHHLSRDLPLSAGLSALYVYESQVAEVANAKIDGLARFYGFPEDTKAEGTKFFETHRNADPYHAQAVAHLIEHHDTRPEDRAIALEAGRTALKAVWDLLDCV